MRKMKTEKEVREFFGSTTLKFELMCDGVADFNTVSLINDNGDYKHFKISLFPNDNPFGAYESLDNLLSVMQIFEVLDLSNKEVIYHQKYIDFKNN